MVRVNAIFPEETLEKLGTIAKEEKKSRSMLIREAVENLIEEHQRMLEERRRKARLERAVKVQDRLRKKAGDWNGVSEIRKWRESAR